MTRLRFALTLAVLPLGACTGAAANYPSLAIRDAERVRGTLQPPATELYAPPSTPPAVLDDLGALVRQAAGAHASFTANVAETRQMVAAARNADPGGDPWTAAQLAVSDLETHRAEAMIALADLDRLYTQAAVEGGATGEIAAARDQVEEMIAEESAIIESLLTSL